MLGCQQLAKEGENLSKNVSKDHAQPGLKEKRKKKKTNKYWLARIFLFRLHLESYFYPDEARLSHRSL